MAFISQFVLLAVWSVYSLYCYAQYNPELRSSHWYLAIAFGYSLLSTAAWVLLSRYLSDSASIVKYAAFWDAGVCIVAGAVPLVIFHREMNPITIVGLSITCFGTLMVTFADQLSNLFKT